MKQLRSPRVVASLIEIDTAPDPFRQLTADWQQARGMHRNLPLLGDVLNQPELPRAAWLMLWRVGEGTGTLDPALAAKVASVARLPQPAPAELSAGLACLGPCLHEVRVGRMPEPQRYQRLSLPLSDDGAEADWLLTFGLPANPDLALWLDRPDGEPNDQPVAA